MKRYERCRISGSYSEIPLLLSLFYLFGGVEAGLTDRFLALKTRWQVGPCRRHYQVGSLTGAEHLLNGNAGVLR